MITLITPTCDQPTGIALCEKFIQRQTVQPTQWIVVDDGTIPAVLTMGQTHVLRDRNDCNPAQSFCRNMLAAMPLVTESVVIFIEHDDWYSPDHLKTVCDQLTSKVLLAGDDAQRYYNVRYRCWRLFQNRGSSLCQTGMRSELLPRLEMVLQACLAASQYGVDALLWARTPYHQKSLRHTDTVVGIKGLPGRPGLGIGHRPESKWTYDPRLEQLQAWIGEDALLYKAFNGGVSSFPVSLRRRSGALFIGERRWP